MKGKIMYKLEDWMKKYNDNLSVINYIQFESS